MTHTDTCYLVLVSHLGKDGVYHFAGWATYSAAPWELTADLSGRTICSTFFESHGNSYDHAYRELLRITKLMAEYGREPWVTDRQVAPRHARGAVRAP